jgi:hypothetical protein
MVIPKAPSQSPVWQDLAGCDYFWGSEEFSELISAWSLEVNEITRK